MLENWPWRIGHHALQHSNGCLEIQQYLRSQRPPSAIQKGNATRLTALAVLPLPVTRTSHTSRRRHNTSLGSGASCGHPDLVREKPLLTPNYTHSLTRFPQEQLLLFSHLGFIQLSWSTLLGCLVGFYMDIPHANSGR